jgi:hypothetical protein
MTLFSGHAELGSMVILFRRDLTKNSSNPKIEIDDITDVGLMISSNSNIIFVSELICVEPSTGIMDTRVGPVISLGPPVAGACAAQDKTNNILIIKIRGFMGAKIYDN